MSMSFGTKKEEKKSEKENLDVNCSEFEETAPFWDLSTNACKHGVFSSISADNPASLLRVEAVNLLEKKNLSENLNEVHLLSVKVDYIN